MRIDKCLPHPPRLAVSGACCGLIFSVSLSTGRGLNILSEIHVSVGPSLCFLMATFNYSRRGIMVGYKLWW
jgi:hypothetical protein